MNKIVSFILYGLFALAGIVAFYLLSFRPIVGFLQAQHWQQVPCQVIKSDILKNTSGRHGRSNTSYKVNIEYQFNFSGKPYTGNKYQFVEFYSSGYNSKKKIIDSYPVGLKIFCYVNPDNPNESVIDRKPGWYMVLAFFPLPFLLIGFSGFYTLLKKKEVSNEIKTPDKIILHESLSPINTFLITLLACVFWNTCNIVMFYNWWLPQYQQYGTIPIFNTLFFSIFVFSGLLLIFAVFYNFLSIFNPRIIIELNTNTLITGGNYSITYKIMGNVQRLTDLNITLVGNEVIASGAGRSRTQNNFTAYESTIYHETSHRLNPNGQAQLIISEDFMPSFSGKNNKIEWLIIATGNIPFWPNMKHEFPITIFPSL